MPFTRPTEPAPYLTTRRRLSARGVPVVHRAKGERLIGQFGLYHKTGCGQWLSQPIELRTPEYETRQRCRRCFKEGRHAQG